MQFHILSFEGPDAYARAGGIATRITGLSDELARQGVVTHLWFIGDPSLPGLEKKGALTLHRWCQWISAYHPAGVYDGEEGKVGDYSESCPPHVFRELVSPLARGEQAVVLAEEWHTVPAVLHLDHLLRLAGLRHRVVIVWNANNTFGFDRIDWGALRAAAVITTVSRYMRHGMRRYGVEALVVPNGLGADAFVDPDRDAVAALHHRFAERTALTKMARWDPDKRWLWSVETLAVLKNEGARPILLARGGLEAHGDEVKARARALNLRVVEATLPEAGAGGLVRALGNVKGADIVILNSHVDPDARRTLFRASDAVLANSHHEPFGLVGLEAMAAGGVACTGCTGEDYAVSGKNALVLETEDPREFSKMFYDLRRDSSAERALRRAGKKTAREYRWSEVVQRGLWPRLQRLQFEADGRQTDLDYAFVRSSSSPSARSLRHRVTRLMPRI